MSTKPNEIALTQVLSDLSIFETNSTISNEEIDSFIFLIKAQCEGEHKNSMAILEKKHQEKLSQMEKELTALKAENLKVKLKLDKQDLTIGKLNKQLVAAKDANDSLEIRLLLNDLVVKVEDDILTRDTTIQTKIRVEDIQTKLKDFSSFVKKPELKTRNKFIRSREMLVPNSVMDDVISDSPFKTEEKIKKSTKHFNSLKILTQEKMRKRNNASVMENHTFFKESKPVLMKLKEEKPLPKGIKVKMTKVTTASSAVSKLTFGVKKEVKKKNTLNEFLNSCIKKSKI